MTVGVRAVDPERDWPGVAALLTRHGPERVEAGELAEEHDRVVEGKLLRRFVAESEGAVVGTAVCIRYPSQPAGLYHVLVVADSEGGGIGSLLARRLEQELASEPVEELWVDVREDRPRGLQFARQHGFEEQRRQLKAILDLEDWDAERSADALDRVEALGVRLLSFAETAGDEAALRALYEVNRVAALDDPSSAGGFPPYEAWTGLVPRSSGFDPGGQILAELDGRLVGLAAVGRSGSTAWNAITGVLPEHRGKGIGRALKVRAATYAKEAGALTLETETNVENHPIRAVNRALGYRELPGYRTLSRRV